MAKPIIDLLENRFHAGDRPFYLARHRAGYAMQPQKSFTRQHFHTGLEIGGVVQGKGWLIFDQQKHRLRAGDVFFLDPMLPHESWGTDLDLVVAHLTRESVVNAHVDKGDLRLVEPFIAVRNGLTPVRAEAQIMVEQLLNAVAENEKRTPAGKQRAFFVVLNVIESLCESVEGAVGEQLPGGKENRRTAARIVEFIHTHFERDIDMQAIAHFAGLSVSGAAHLFKECTGLSPIEFRNQVRITHALERIKLTNETMSSIALSCGFNNTSQFYRMFKKFAGVPPNHVRRGP